ncbi:MAG: mitochondrial fission ELM1 family protein [Candidatus Omnitrophica bacterium]|nr:mitochondrial fission ELM1 family protein [Candidatus Omnitrophota bacterium]
MKESIIYYSVRAFGFFIRSLPIGMALGVGKGIGMLAYYFDIKHKSRAYSNLKMAFAHCKTPNEIKLITKQLFKNYGQNLVELFRMPLMTKDKFDRIVKVEGKEHVTESLKLGKGVIILAMHFGSWELASLSCAMLGYPYNIFVKPQPKHNKLDDLLNSYRACSGSVVLSRGSGTRDFVRSLKNNEVIGMVVDQGGRDGVLVPFLGRQATMSVGAIRMGLKLGVPVCFSAIIRERGFRHKMIIHEPFRLENTGDIEADVIFNLKKVTKIMEDYIHKYPSEYMWFYKIWKYSNEARIAILSDQKTGHLRQSQCVAQMTEKALAERGIKATTQVIQVVFKDSLKARLFSVLSVLFHPYVYQGRLQCLKWFLTPESFQSIAVMKADFIISCGSSVAGVNNVLSRDSSAKSIVVLKPGLLNYGRFDLVVLPQHDEPKRKRGKNQFAITYAAPNLVMSDYLKEQSQSLLLRFSHLKDNLKPKIGLFIGGEAKSVYLSDRQIKIVIRQIKEVLKEINTDILITTSRRTPESIEQMFFKEFKNDPNCPLLILANRENVPEAVGGILGVCDIAIVSGDSLSMVSEAASSGKRTIVFSPQMKAIVLKGENKHQAFAERLNAQGFVLSTDVTHLGQSIYDVAKGKIQTKQIDDRGIILEAMRKVI